MLKGMNGALATGALRNGVVVISCCSDLRLFPSSNLRTSFLCFFLIQWRLDCTPQHSLNSSASTVDDKIYNYLAHKPYKTDTCQVISISVNPLVKLSPYTEWS